MLLFNNVIPILIIIAYIVVPSFNQDQYIFIHDAILESVTCGDTQIDAGNLRTSLDKLLQNDQPGRTEMDIQFAVGTSIVMQYFSNTILTIQHSRYWIK